MSCVVLRPPLLFDGGLEAMTERMQRVFLVTDPFMVKSGKAAYVTGPLEQAGRVWQVFSDVPSEPDTKVISEGVAQMMAFRPDTVIGLGGGAAMDAAKAMVLAAGKLAGGERLFFVAIPTTSGTGSEVTNFSVISDREAAAKYPLTDERMLPDAAILDAALTASVPPAVTADTGIDALTHAIEAYVSTRHNDFSDAAAEKAIRLIHTHLRTAYRYPDHMDARQRMHNASCLAGIAFNNSGLGLTHGMAHALGGRFHIPHGRANALVLPYVIEFNASRCPSAYAARYADIAGILGAARSSRNQSIFNLIRAVRSLIAELDIPLTIRDAGISREDWDDALPRLARAAAADRCTETNPVLCTVEDITALFEKAYQGE